MNNLTTTIASAAFSSDYAPVLNLIRLLEWTEINTSMSEMICDMTKSSHAWRLISQKGKMVSIRLH